LNLQVEELEAFKTKAPTRNGNQQGVPEVTLPSNPDSFPPMQIDKISHIAVGCVKSIAHQTPP
jgi:hypothetical protein